MKNRPGFSETEKIQVIVCYEFIENEAFVVEGASVEYGQFQVMLLHERV